MRFLTRASAVAAVAALTAAVVLVPPGSEPVARAAQPADLPPDLALVPPDAIDRPKSASFCLIRFQT